MSAPTRFVDVLFGRIGSCAGRKRSWDGTPKPCRRDACSYGAGRFADWFICSDPCNWWL